MSLPSSDSKIPSGRRSLALATALTVICDAAERLRNSISTFQRIRHMRNLVVIACIAMIGAMVVVVSQRPIGSAHNLPAAFGDSTANGSLTRPATLNPTGTINVAVTPQLIPEDVAYSLFFRFVANHRSGEQRNRLRSYIRQGILSDIDVDALIVVADDFRQAAAIIDNDQRALSSGSLQSTFAIESQFAKLRELRVALVNEKVRQLRTSIGDNDTEKIRRYVMEYVRRRVKIIPARHTASSR